MLDLNFSEDAQGHNAFGPKVADSLYSVTLSPGQDATITVPASDVRLIMVISYSPSSEFWVSASGSAEIPAGNTFAATGSCMNPAQLNVAGGDELNFINNSASSKSVGVSFYAVP